MKYGTFAHADSSATSPRTALSTGENLTCPISGPICSVACMRARDGEPPGAPDISVFEGANQQLRSPPTPSGFTGHFAPIAGCCFVSAVRCWRTAGASVAATSSPRMASLVASYAQEALLRFRNAGAQVDA